MDIKEIKEEIESRGIEVIRLWFTDILGNLKGFNLGIGEIDRALEEGIGFDGSSVEGFVRIEESDLIAVPDKSTFFILPLDIGGAPTACFICDIQYPDGTPCESDPRHVLKKTLEKIKKDGFTFYVGPELEYFYFPDDKNPLPLDEGGYFDVLPFNKAVNVRKETVLALKDMGFQVEASHHEVAMSQHELDFRYNEALRMADTLQIAKVVIKAKAHQHGLYATFMPKPLFGHNGSGLHLHHSIFKKGKNAFFGEDGPYHLSETAQQFLAGLLKHSKEITAITNQWINSYKRLVVGYEAPVYIAWGRRNRSALVRVPAFKPYRPSSCRLEYRASDPATNPYLAFSVLLAAGLKGVQEKLPLPEPVEKDIYAMPDEVKAKYGIDSLPDSLYSATLAMERSQLVKETLGEALFEKYIKNKKTEWEKYRIQVTDYEIKNYLPKL